MPPTRATTQLTYCTNVHPAHSAEDILAMLLGPVSEVSRLLTSNHGDHRAGFCVGLRLSGEAARQFAGDAQLADQLHRMLRERGMFVSTINGFPFGAFHGEPVKAQVYLPDWRTNERAEYTSNLIAVLSGLLPDARMGSISTVPGAFKVDASAPAQRQAISRNLLTVVSELALLERTTGKHIVLALEPEPACLLETTAETLEFFEGQLLSHDALTFLSGLGHAHATVESLVRRHLGVCLDTCHAAVEFESALGAYEQYVSAGIRVPKIQVSAGLIVDPSDAAQLTALRDFDEPVYLHQVVARNAGVLSRFDDLQLAFAASTPWSPDAEWRVHFHVPLFTDEYGVFSSTRSEVTPLLEHLRSAEDAPLLEVETYTWDVLPERFRNEDKCEAIARELAWVEQQLTVTTPDGSP